VAGQGGRREGRRRDYMPALLPPGGRTANRSENRPPARPELKLDASGALPRVGAASTPPMLTTRWPGHEGATAARYGSFMKQCGGSWRVHPTRKVLPAPFRREGARLGWRLGLPLIRCEGARLGWRLGLPLWACPWVMGLPATSTGWGAWGRLWQQCCTGRVTAESQRVAAWPQARMQGWVWALRATRAGSVGH